MHELEDIEGKISEEVGSFKERALKKIDQGSAYSSEFEEIEESDYVSTDGEAARAQDQNIITMQRGATIKRMDGPVTGVGLSKFGNNAIQPQKLNAALMNGSFGGPGTLPPTTNLSTEMAS